jgi:hypothetical protein
MTTEMVPQSHFSQRFRRSTEDLARIRAWSPEPCAYRTYGRCIRSVVRSGEPAHSWTGCRPRSRASSLFAVKIRSPDVAHLTRPAGAAILSRVADGLAEFSSAMAVPVLAEACTSAGFPSDGAELLRLGENAIYQLASAPVVVRIARSADRLAQVEKELCVARWLDASDIPAVHVVEDIEQPLMVDGHPVSFWHAVAGGDLEPTQADLARLLAAFHSLPDCPCELPAFDPLGPSTLRLARARGVASMDVEFLQTRCASLSDQFRDLTFALPVGPIHGDAHTGNLLVDRGQVVLSDFESSAIGPREWDLLPTAIAVERYGLAEDRYWHFAASYGFDVRGWPGYPVLREIRELTMTTWIMQNIGESSAIADEFSRRVGSLRDRDFERAWNLF